MPGSKSSIFRFDDVEVREREFSLTKAGEVLPVEPKAFRVLLILLRNPQRLFPKEELLNAVWGDAVVTENSLTRSIALLRRLLADDIRNPRYIETVATVGYRFLCSVEMGEDTLDNLEGPNKTKIQTGGGSDGSLVNGEATDPQVQIEDGAYGEAKADPGKNERNNRVLNRMLPVAAVFLVGLGSTIWYLRRPLPLPHVTQYNRITYDGKVKNLAGGDSSRLYFNRDPYHAEGVAQISISGGEIAPVPMAFPGPWILDVSPDGSTLLVSSFDGAQPSLWSVRVPGGSNRRLLTNERVPSAAWSPDGRSVVYRTVDNQKVANIFVMKSDGTGVSQLASAGIAGTFTGGDVSWSPDGKTIRFTNNDELWTILSNGSNLGRLLPAWSQRDICCGRWTSDGEFFVFLSQGANKTVMDRINWSGAQIWALDERRGLFRRWSSEPVQLTSGPIRWRSAIPSKDGTKIFAEGRVVRGELVHLDVNSKQLQPWLGGISAEYFTFSPDGKFMAYVTYPEGILWRANRDGSSPEQLTSRPIYPINPRWSPDGAQILFFDFASANHAQSYIIPSQGGTPSLLLPGDKGSQGDPNWSPDGGKILFSSSSGINTPSDQDIRVLDLASHQVTIVPGSKGIFSPRWSPNGRFIAALTDRVDITIFDFEKQRWSLLFKRGVDSTCDYPTWSRDGEFIYFMQGGRDPGVFRIRASGGTPERVLDLTGFRFTGALTVWMGLDPQDTPLLIRDVGTEDIYALTLETK